ncbi:hypothetical protein CBR_g49574 [Chara braunii]|uniref:CCHC-type domain-containing protein n=1 Tax=Chara braunii TaxID=69332 RepID=A0A388M588_CHABU|nr:hypothetical protein CBR_g49574 [Chara braunii]|eukprot:GBG89721.1 hypothetical protein CBR_g49574 [Chara braunii]
MFLTNGNNLGAYGNGNAGYNGNNYGEGRGGAQASGGMVGGGDGYAAGGNVGRGPGDGGCYNCGKPGHFARDCWARRGKPYQHSQGDPELEEIKEFHRQARKERMGQEEMKRIEEEKRVKAEEDNRRNQDFARKMEEFKLQLRVDLNEEWRKKNLEAEKATSDFKKKTVARRMNPGSRAKKSNGKGRRVKRRHYIITSEDSTSGTSSGTADSSSSSGDSNDEGAHERTSKGKGKRNSKGKSKQGKGNTKSPPIKGTPRRYETGEWKGKGSGTRCNRVDITERSEDEEEPKTPLTGGYKGLSAGCSQKGLIEYCISAHKIYSAKKAHALRRIRERRGMKYTTKPEVVEQLARQQVELPYEGFEEGVGKGKEAMMDKQAATPKADVNKDKAVHISQKRRPRTRFTELPDELVPGFVRNAKNITKPGHGVRSEAVLQVILEATKHLKGQVSRPELLPGTFRCEEHRSLAWTDEAVRAWGKKFAGLVLTQIDRNTGDTVVFCPVLYRHGFRKLFTWNTNYITVGRAEDEAELMKKYREDFREYEMESIGKRRPDGRLGTAYVIPKHKDLVRWRPIAPAPSDPAALAQEYIDKGWRYVKVSFRGKACVISETKKKLDGYVTISLPALLEAVRYDLQHSSINCGGKLMQQVFGIPMGKSTSPILASITCAMSERRLLSTLGNDRKLVGGWRIMDDISVIVGSSDKSRSCPEDIFRAFEECYDSNLEIVRKDDCGLTWPFVGGSFFIRNKPLQLHFIPNGKNTDALREKGKLVFETMQDYSSCSDKAVKKAVLAAAIRGLWDQTTCKKLVLGAIAFAICEANLRGYAPEVSLGALAKLAKAARNEYLDKMLAIFRCAAALARY